MKNFFKYTLIISYSIILLTALCFILYAIYQTFLSSITFGILILLLLIAMISAFFYSEL